MRKLWRNSHGRGHLSYLEFVFKPRLQQKLSSDLYCCQQHQPNLRHSSNKSHHQQQHAIKDDNLSKWTTELPSRAKVILKKLSENTSLEDDSCSTKIIDSHEHKLQWLEGPRTCFIVKKPNDEKTNQAFYNIIQYFSMHHPDINVIVEPDTVPLFQSFTSSLAKKVVYLAPPEIQCEEYNRVVDFAIALGGDGTILHLSSLFPKSVPPIISFSLGTLGFLLPYQIQHFRIALRSLVEGQATVMLRMRLACGIYENDQDEMKKKRLKGFNQDVQAMNEVLLYRGRMTHLTSLKVTVNNKVLTHAIADGLLLATPTGSTAYSLSAGGPIVHPSVQSVIMTPICPRSLSFRPIILPHTSNIQVSLTPNSRSNAELTIDGRSLHMLQKNECIQVKMSSYPIPCVNRLLDDETKQESLAVHDTNSTRDSRKVSSSCAIDWVKDINVMLRFNQGFRSMNLRHFDDNNEDSNDFMTKEKEDDLKIGS